MPVLIWETARSRPSTTGRDATVRIMYMVTGTEDERTVRLLVLATAPELFEGILFRRSTQVQTIGGGIWTCSADYGFREFQSDKNPRSGGSGGGDSNDGNRPGAHDPIGPHISGSISSRSQHITQSLNTTDIGIKLSDTRDKPDHKGTIGVSKRQVEGCDIPVPEFKWSEAWTFAPQFVTWDYLRLLRDIVGRVNGQFQSQKYDGKFRGFDPGEVMFVGADFDAEGLERVKFTFHFWAEPNVLNFKLTPDFDPVDKYGHDYLWVEYEESTSPTDVLKVPRAVFVEEVGRPADIADENGFFNRANFLRIGIGS